MPLVNYPKKTKDSPILWEMTEDEDFFMNGILLNNSEKEKVASYSNPQRRKEFLCTRFITQNVLGIESVISYNENGKPYFNDKNDFISISHSKDLVGIYTHSNINIGLDIEIIHPKIEKIASRFINDHEWKYIKPSDQILSFVLIWSAKESILKIHGIRTLNFKDNINILPFKVQDSGVLNCQLIDIGKGMDITLKYFRHKDYYIVYGTETT